MKFKEALNLDEVTFCDDIKKHFDEKTVEKYIELEKTQQQYWNVDRNTANFLNLMIKMTNAKSALEIGTSNGYSSIWLATALKTTGGHLTTIEFWEKRIEIAVENFKKTGVDKIITPITGDAVDILKNMDKEFDFVFLDANKAEYIQYFNAIDPMVKNNGVIIADNILSHYKKTKDYVNAIMNNKNYQSQLLNIDTGVLVSFKTPAYCEG